MSHLTHHSPGPARSHRRKISTVFGLSAVVALVLSGCSAADQADNNGGDNGDENQTVTMMTHDSFSVSEELLAQFEEESGYTVTTTAPGDAGAVVNQLILQQDSPTVDGFFGVENYSAQTLLDENFLQDYSGQLPESAQNLAVDGSDALVPIDHGQVCINADTEWFDDNDLELPETLDDLTDENYKDLLVTSDPNDSSPGLAFLVATRTEFGDDAEQYWEDLFDNGVKVAGGWSDAYYTDFSGSEGEGPYPLVVSYSSSPAAEEGRTTSIDGTCIQQIEYAGVLEDAENPEGAQAFIDFMLSEEFQADIPEQMFMYPVDDSIELPDEWSEYASLTEDPIEPDLQEVADQREDWLNSWTETYEAQ
ncbi:thiamine ABC transporter substrate-binding protein [Auritidibacter ignavus]|uniref:thiamine ABC transporter substrate-binding protein n=1 Tax=Auritidibacter ignavus TaxID=678932 RepID=UPI000F040F7F|nr:thiamine ABC transporter substrate-binding protein [Auritidibacter ignavus]NIH71174.1 thiamine transport system substrate-binding protein [Auritidibacter ignavus]RMX22899.1 thiamine ABC transporter substrate-binding protein [Auritidibacter ignavus]WGH85401.1 thiamine ABC transporter substrate-binding protein [Auritidibacter ignavus]WGH87687.1 thiamine ABC transporter substrate-binding protein [Auritidibacter ignavus]WHS28759.1 thiamine ABC transporter substrate-binding protein [Auritidibact